MIEPSCNMGHLGAFCIQSLNIRWTWQSHMGEATQDFGTRTNAHKKHQDSRLTIISINSSSGLSRDLWRLKQEMPKNDWDSTKGLLIKTMIWLSSRVSEDLPGKEKSIQAPKEPIKCTIHSARIALSNACEHTSLLGLHSVRGAPEQHQNVLRSYQLSS